MPKPRYIVPGTSYLLTRRCSERRFFLTPDADGVMSALFGYALAVCSRRYGVEVHAGVVLGNHTHFVVTDVRGELSDFLRELHSMTASCVNDKLGRRENLWATRQASAVILVDSGAVWAKLVYCLANAVSSGLVPTHTSWPGFHTRPDSVLAAPRTFMRPAFYFGDGTRMPEDATLAITKPPAFAHMSDEEYVDELTRRVKAEESNLRRTARLRRRHFVGVPSVLAQDPKSAPKTSARKRPDAINPEVAAEDRSTRIAMLHFLADFRHAYAEARDLWRQGLRLALFPYGTFALMRHHRVCVAPAPT